MIVVDLSARAATTPHDHEFRAGGHSITSRRSAHIRTFWRVEEPCGFPPGPDAGLPMTRGGIRRRTRLGVPRSGPAGAGPVLSGGPLGGRGDVAEHPAEHDAVERGYRPPVSVAG